MCHRWPPVPLRLGHPSSQMSLVPPLAAERYLCCNPTDTTVINIHQYICCTWMFRSPVMLTVLSHRRARVCQFRLILQDCINTSTSKWSKLNKWQELRGPRQMEALCACVPFLFCWSQMQSSRNTHELAVSSAGTNKRHWRCLISHHNNHCDILWTQAAMLIRSVI